MKRTCPIDGARCAPDCGDYVPGCCNVRDVEQMRAKRNRAGFAHGIFYEFRDGRSVRAIARRAGLRVALVEEVIRNTVQRLAAETQDGKATS